MVAGMVSTIVGAPLISRTVSVSQCGASRRASLVVRAQADPRRTVEESGSLVSRAAACSLAAVLLASNLSPALAQPKSGSQGDAYAQFVATPGSKAKLLEAKKAPAVAALVAKPKVVAKVAASKPAVPKRSAPKPLSVSFTAKAAAATSGDTVLKVAPADVRRGVQGNAPTSIPMPVPKSQQRQEAAAAKAEAEKRAAFLKAEAAKPKSEAQKKAEAAAAALAATAAAEQAAESQRVADLRAAAESAERAIASASSSVYEAAAVVAVEVLLATAASSFVKSFSGKSKKAARA